MGVGVGGKMDWIFLCVSSRKTALILQKKEILSDPKLPDIFRVALAKSLQDDLFAQVRRKHRLLPRAKTQCQARGIEALVVRRVETRLAPAD